MFRFCTIKQPIKISSWQGFRCHTPCSRPIGRLLIGEAERSRVLKNDGRGTEADADINLEQPTVKGRHTRTHTQNMNHYCLLAWQIGMGDNTDDCSRRRCCPGRLLCIKMSREVSPLKHHDCIQTQKEQRKVCFMATLLRLSLSG